VEGAEEEVVVEEGEVEVGVGEEPDVVGGDDGFEEVEGGAVMVAARKVSSVAEVAMQENQRRDGEFEAIQVCQWQYGWSLELWGGVVSCILCIGIGG
jgi:hypothetical protein